MKIIHTADLHLGQVIYQNYERADEHAHFFNQLAQWCVDEQPDALLVTGDVFDVPQPSAAVRQAFVNYFVELHRRCPSMKIIITAGNHDSPSRLQADRQLWQLANATIVGVAPAMSAGTDGTTDWMEPYIVRLAAGYIIAMPYMASDRHTMLQAVLDSVAEENTDGLPVVMTAHTTVEGMNPQGHDIEAGNLRALPLESFGRGYDYLALGHIHKAQTLGMEGEGPTGTSSHAAPVARYAGSALHVSCDEAYPHTVSVVEIDRHGGSVELRRLRIDQLRHFHTLPADGAFDTADEALDAVRQAVGDGLQGYFRLCIDHAAALPPNFSQLVYDILAGHEDELRYNPKILWSGTATTAEAEADEPMFELAELQQMTDPMAFIERTADRYGTFTLDELREAFAEVCAEVARMEETGKAKKGKQ